MTSARTVAFVVPEGVDDEARVSGGNVYDLRLRDGLRALGWRVRFAQVTVDAAAAAFSAVEDDGLVLVDGLVAARSAAALEAEAERLRIVLLAHMVSAAFPGADRGAVAGERRALAVARLVVATSDWTRSELVRARLVDEERVVVAHPGCDDVPIAVRAGAGSAILCLGVVAPHKGQDVLVEALAAVADEGDWTCTIAGSLDAEPAFAHRVERLARERGVGDRVRLPGVLKGRALDDAYAAADLVVAPSRVESYGMVVADALRRGIPVVASEVGGIPEAIARGRGAILVPPGDRAALERALGRWMADPGLRARLADGARSDRARLPTWSNTAARVSAALEEAR